MLLAALLISMLRSIPIAVIVTLIFFQLVPDQRRNGTLSIPRLIFEV